MNNLELLDARKWGWMFPESDYACGPYETRDEALSAARNEMGGASQVTILVGRCDPIRPASYISTDMDRVLDQMEESVFDDYGCFDAPIFEVGDRDKAQYALENLLKMWAHLHVSTGHWILDDAKKVSLRRNNEEAS